MKLGFIARNDNSGLGIESRAFIRHFKPKVLYVKVAEDGARIVPTDDEITEFLKGLDVLFTIETPYNWNTYTIARDMGVKSVLRVNYEWLPEFSVSWPDFFLLPINYHLKDIPDPKKILFFPVEMDYKPRKTAKTFVHVAGMIGQADRNGTSALLKAIPLVKSDVRFIIYSQKPLEIDDPRVEVCGEVDDYRTMYLNGDVFILPRRYAGQSLTIHEAMAAGMPVMTTDMKPYDEIAQFLIPVEMFGTIKLFRDVEYAIINPEEIAKSIDELYGKDISEESKQAREFAESISWENLKAEYEELFEML